MDYNNLFIYDNGQLFWKDSSKTGDVGYETNDGYRCVYIDRKSVRIHRIIWEMHFGPIPDGLSIDHINRIRNDNRIENLRLCTHQQNHFNRVAQSNNKSGYKGVCWHKQKQKWVAQIKIDGRNKFLGFFNNPTTAYEKYCEVARERYGEFANV
jgi:hypothetical protein